MSEAGEGGAPVGRSGGDPLDALADNPACLFCGEPERFEIVEVWGHEFIFETCCEPLHEIVVHDMNDDPAWARELLRRAGIEALVGRQLRRLTDDEGCSLLLDYQLELRDVTLAAARDFVARHHRHCNPPATWRFGASIFNGHTLLGVVMVGNPVAPAFNGRGTLEVNRLCIRRDIPRPLAWNAASMLYGWSAREAQLLGWTRIITYTRIDEEGVSLRAAGWTQDGRVRGRGWHSGRRSRSNTNSWIDKVRWSRALNPKRVRPTMLPPNNPASAPSEWAIIAGLTAPFP